MKFWWMSVRDISTGDINLRGPWPHSDNVNPFNECKKFDVRDELDFIVFPLNFRDKRDAKIRAQEIWNNTELREMFLQLNVHKKER